jgi:hypothetical protein
VGAADVCAAGVAACEYRGEGAGGGLWEEHAWGEAVLIEMELMGVCRRESTTAAEW